MLILITGVAGFIGSHTCQKMIQEGHNVIGIDNFDPFYPKKIKLKNLDKLIKSDLFQFFEGDIRDVSFLDNLFKENKFSLVIHLAAKAGVRPSINTPNEFYDVNVIGTLNLLELMKKHYVFKLIFASSSSVYGNNIKIPYSELDIVDYPISPYAASKKSGELLTHTYHNLYKIDVVNLRFFTVYGPGQRPDLAIHKFFINLYSNVPIDIYGDGSTSRDYTFIEDIVDGVNKSAEFLFKNKNIYQIINLGNHTPIVLSDLILLIEDVTDKKFLKKNMPMQLGDVNNTYADISKANSILSYYPKTNLRDGLIKFKYWYEENS